MARRRAEFEGPFLDYIAELSVEDASAVLAAAIAAHPERQRVDATLRYPSRTPKTTRWQWQYPRTATMRPLMWDSPPTPWGTLHDRSLNRFTPLLWASYAEVPPWGDPQNATTHRRGNAVPGLPRRRAIHRDYGGPRRTGALVRAWCAAGAGVEPCLPVRGRR